MKKKVLAAVFAMALVFSTLTAQATDATGTVIEVDEIAMEYELTGEDGIASISIEDGILPLKEGHYEAWVDRVDWTGAEEVRALYDSLVEGSDNDGVGDFLIEDSYFAKDTDVLVATVEGPLESIDKAQAVMQDVLARYSPYAVAAVTAFDKDHPEVFWLTGSTRLTIGGQIFRNTDQTYTYRFTVKMMIHSDDKGFDIRSAEYRSEAAIKEGIVQRDGIVTNYLNAVKDKTPYEKLLYFNEELTKKNEYNTSADLNTIANNCRECINALQGHTGTEGPVCESYARAFKVLCDAADIPCVLEDGMSYNTLGSGAHMWNCVKIGNQWYNADITWDDPTGGNSGAVSGYENTGYLLVGSQTEIDGMKFEESHVTTNRVSGSNTQLTNGPLVSKTAYDPTAAAAFTVHCNITCSTTAGTGAVTVELIPEGAAQAAYSAQTTAATLDIENVADGKYTMRVSKEHYAAREYTVTVSGADLTQNVKICPLGDTNGDGRVNIADLSYVYAYVQGICEMEDYQLACANVVTSNAAVNIMDVNRLYAHIRGVNVLW